jgi:hypothetical protein
MVSTSIKDNPKEKMIIESPIAVKITLGKSIHINPTGGRAFVNTKKRIRCLTKSIIYPAIKKVPITITTPTVPKGRKITSVEIFKK